MNLKLKKLHNLHLRASPKAERNSKTVATRSKLEVLRPASRRKGCQWRVQQSQWQQC